ncbi:unnamed protein product [Colias eurytheme]|nr:unnamed protein product [Colias eurytheme]
MTLTLVYSYYNYQSILCCSVTYIKCYVLFAANVADFKRIAEKLGSEKLMNQLLQIPHDSTFKNFKQVNARKERIANSKYNIEDRDKYIKKPIARQREPKSSLNLKEDGTKIDFEELVERVKQRLESEFKNKYKGQVVREKAQNTEIVNTKKIKEYKEGHIQMRPKKKMYKHNVNIKSTIRTTTTSPVIDDNNYDYEDAMPQNGESHERTEVNIEAKNNKREPMYAEAMLYEADTKSPKINIKYELLHNKTKVYYDNIYDYETEHTNNQQDDLPFKKITMKEDSYDYVAPPKERNIYASKETTAHNRYKIRNRLKITPDYKTQTESNDYEMTSQLVRRKSKQEQKNYGMTMMKTQE